MKKWFLLLISIGFMVSVEAQVLIDEFIIGSSPILNDTTTLSTNNNIHDDNALKNSLGHEVDVFLSKKFLFFWRARQGAFKGSTNESSTLPSGLIKKIEDFELGDNLVIRFPTDAFYRDGIFTGAKIIFDHRISANQVGMYMDDNKSVEIVFEISEVEPIGGTPLNHGMINHVWGHLCNPLDPTCE